MQHFIRCFIIGLICAQSIHYSLNALFLHHYHASKMSNLASAKIQCYMSNHKVALSSLFLSSFVIYCLYKLTLKKIEKAEQKAFVAQNYIDTTLSTEHT